MTALRQRKGAQRTVQADPSAHASTPPPSILPPHQIRRPFAAKIAGDLTPTCGVQQLQPCSEACTATQLLGVTGHVDSPTARRRSSAAIILTYHPPNQRTRPRDCNNVRSSVELGSVWWRRICRTRRCRVEQPRLLRTAAHPSAAESRQHISWSSCTGLIWIRPMGFLLQLLAWMSRGCQE